MEKMSFPYCFVRCDSAGKPVFALEIFQYTLAGDPPFYIIVYSIPALRTSNYPKIRTIEEVLLKRLVSDDHEYCLDLINEIANEVMKTPELARVGIPDELIDGKHINWIHLNWTTRERSESFKWGYFVEHMIEKHYPLLVVSENKTKYLFNLLSFIVNNPGIFLHPTNVRDLISLLKPREMDELLDVLTNSSILYRMRSDYNSDEDDEVFIIQEKNTITGYVIFEKNEFKRRSKILNNNTL